MNFTEGGLGARVLDHVGRDASVQDGAAFRTENASPSTRGALGLRKEPYMSICGVGMLFHIGECGVNVWKFITLYTTEAPQTQGMRCRSWVAFSDCASDQKKRGARPGERPFVSLIVSRSVQQRTVSRAVLHTGGVVGSEGWRCAGLEEITGPSGREAPATARRSAPRRAPRSTQCSSLLGTARHTTHGSANGRW